VLVQALRFGCYPVTTDLDCAWEATHGGKFGKIFDIDQRDQLVAILVDVCTNEPLLESTFGSIMRYAQQHYAFRSIVQRIHKLLELGVNESGEWLCPIK